jgi:hypothetical protein
VKGKKRDAWMLLCEQAAQEQDPNKLMKLVKEIVRLLDEKQERVSKESFS